MAPMIVPSIITAVALYIFFARTGLLGSFVGLVLGHTILAVPYVVLDHAGRDPRLRRPDRAGRLQRSAHRNCRS